MYLELNKLVPLKTIKDILSKIEERQLNKSIKTKNYFKITAPKGHYVL